MRDVNAPRWAAGARTEEGRDGARRVRGQRARDEAFDQDTRGRQEGEHEKPGAGGDVSVALKHAISLTADACACGCFGRAPMTGSGQG